MIAQNDLEKVRHQKAAHTVLRDPVDRTEDSVMDGRTTRHAGYKVSQRKRKLVEEALGWGKTIAGTAKLKVRGLARVSFKFTFTMAA